MAALLSTLSLASGPSPPDPPPMSLRAEHLEQFPNMPEAIWEAHRRVEADLEAYEG